jgi:hypothetical protein
LDECIHGYGRGGVSLPRVGKPDPYNDFTR